METNVLPMLRKGRSELCKVITETRCSIDELESKSALLKAEEQTHDRLCYKADTLEEALDYIEIAIKLLENTQ